MKLSLYQRLSVSLFVVFVLILLLFLFAAQYLERQARYESQQQLHLSLAANLARDNPLLQQGGYDHEALKNLFHTLMVLGPAFEFYFVDLNGNVLTHSIAPSLIKRHRISVTPILDLTKNRSPLPIYGDDPQHITRQKVFSAAPVFNGTQLQGYLYVIVAGEHYESIFNRQQISQQFKLSMILLVGAIVFLFVVMLGLFSHITKPLRSLSEAILAAKANHFKQSTLALGDWQHDSNNEVHQLGDVFKQMLKQINQQFNKLHDADVQRRELLADISHDLRTPLASLQGYIETLCLNIDKLTPEQTKQYIDTAFNNAKQLNRLIDQIFELAHLDGGQVSMSLEYFNLAELLYDVIAKFSLKALKKDISLVIEPPHSKVVVHSDIAKLERVLTNLLENAIRHAPVGGKVVMAINIIDQQHCQLAIKDNGTGIKGDELAYIFDTRYRASNAVNSEHKHTGLGLAITKKLLELLNTDIKVASQLGKGTTFSFELRRVEP